MLLMLFYHSTDDIHKSSTS